MSIIKAFDAAFNRMQEKNWEFIYVVIDIHGTIFLSSYNDKEYFKLYPYAEQALKLMSDNPRIKLILWSSSNKLWMKKYSEALNKLGIIVDYLNMNPEVIKQKNDPEQISFDEKFYFNVGIDDKFGFEPEKDWLTLIDYFKKKLS